MAKVAASKDHKAVEQHSKLLRDLLLGFVKIHVLHHADQEQVYGAGIAAELEGHGYKLSPGTLYPLLHNLEAANFLKREDRIVGGKVRKYYGITPLGRRALKEVREKVVELVEEVLPAEAPSQSRRKSG